MKRVRILKGGVQTHGAEMIDADAWIAEQVAANSWGLPSRPELDAEGNPTGITLPAEYEIVIQDVTAEIEAQKAKEAQEVAAKAKLKTLRKSDLSDASKIGDVILDIIKTLRL